MNGRTTLALMSVLLLSLSAWGCAETTYRGAAVEGRVVDAETKQPLQGVIVVIEWQLYRGGWEGNVIGRLLLQETVTDAQGRYRFPAWGPLRPKEGAMDRASPVLNFYKRGYRFQKRYNERLTPDEEFPDPLTSMVNGKTVELAAYSSNFGREDRWEEIVDAPQLFSLSDEKCVWQRIPLMTAELVRRELEYRRHGSSASLPSLEELHQNGKCADPKQLLGIHPNE